MSRTNKPSKREGVSGGVEGGKRERGKDGTASRKRSLYCSQKESGFEHIQPFLSFSLELIAKTSEREELTDRYRW